VSRVVMDAVRRNACLGIKPEPFAGVGIRFKPRIAALEPDFAELNKLDCLGIIVTAKGERYDFVSRFFAPRAGIPEDPVTGSAHTLLVPFWAKRLKKNVLHAIQVSTRRGELFLEYLGERVLIGGSTATFFQGTIEI